MPAPTTETPKPRVLLCAANSGLGLGLLDDLLEGGAHTVVATYRRDPEALVAAFARHGLDPAAHVLRADLADYEETAAAVAAASAAGPLWAIVNLAGTPSARRLAKMDAAEARDVVLGNVLPALHVTKCALETLPANGLGGGRVVHVSSVTVRRPVPGVVPYVAGKAAVEGLVRAAALEGGRDGITVNALRLGYFEAGMTALVPETVLEPVVAATASRRLGSRRDLLHAVLSLIDERSAFQTGAVLDLDGGLR